MAVRLVEMHRVLKDTGSIYLHCDPTASHYLKPLISSLLSTHRESGWIIRLRRHPAAFRHRYSQASYRQAQDFRSNTPLRRAGGPLQRLRHALREAALDYRPQNPQISRRHRPPRQPATPLPPLQLHQRQPPHGIPANKNPPQRGRQVVAYVRRDPLGFYAGRL